MTIYTQRSEMINAFGKVASDRLVVMAESCQAGEIEAATQDDETPFNEVEFFEWLRSQFLQYIRGQAQDYILSAYPLWSQSNIAMGIYPAEVADPAKAWIASVITESNRCEALAYAAESLADLLAITPIWPEVQ